MLLCMMVMEHTKIKEFSYKPSTQITLSNDVQITLSDMLPVCGLATL